MSIKRAIMSLCVGTVAVATFVQFVSADISTGTLVRWAFDEGSGSTADDSSGNGNDATLTGSPSWVDGKTGNALEFSGTNYARSDGSVTVSDTFTVSAWVKPSAAPDVGGFAARIVENSYASSFALGYYNNGTAKVVQLSIEGNALFGVSDIPLGEWSHVVATFDGAVANVYVNGVFDSTGDFSGSITPGSVSLPIYVGTYFGSPGELASFVGAIDDVRVYDRALSSSDVTELYEAASGDTAAPVISSVASSTAATEATVTWTTDEPATSRVFYGATSSYTDSTAQSSATTTSHNVTVSGLSGSTVYHFAVVSMDDAGNYATSSDYTFTTASAVGAPTVTTSAASGLTATAATLNGSVSSTGGEDLSQHGFAYGTSSDLSTAIATTTLGSRSSTGAFQSSVSSLTCGTTYYARAYGTNSAGTAYGSIQSFVTSDCPVQQDEDESDEQQAAPAAPTSSGGRARREAMAASANLVSTTALTPDTVIVLGEGSASVLATFVPMAYVQPAITSVKDTAHPKLVTIGLTYGMIDPAVITLQRMLNADPDTQVAAEGKRGSPGSETTYFGRATEGAVKRFQSKHGLSSPQDPAYGYVGPATRAKLTELYGTLIQG